jgi:hypothetical protein
LIRWNSLAKQDEEELESFREKKRGLDSRTHQLYRSKLHLELRDRKLPKTMTSICAADSDFSHLSAADQRLMNLLAASRDEDLTAADIKDGLYNVRGRRAIAVLTRECLTRVSLIDGYEIQILSMTLSFGLIKTLGSTRYRNGSARNFYQLNGTMMSRIHYFNSWRRLKVGFVNYQVLPWKPRTQATMHQCEIHERVIGRGV